MPCLRCCRFWLQRGVMQSLHGALRRLCLCWPPMPLEADYLLLGEQLHARRLSAHRSDQSHPYFTSVGVRLWSHQALSPSYSLRMGRLHGLGRLHRALVLFYTVVASSSTRLLMNILFVYSGGGEQSRSRTIKTPSLFGGDPCTGSAIETRICNTDPCGTSLHRRLRSRLVWC